MATIDKPAAEWAFVTPEIATDWLGMNIRNRNVRQAVVDRLAEDYADFHPAPISRCLDGTLLDGQHRLMAVVNRERGAWVPRFPLLVWSQARRMGSRGSERRAVDAGHHRYRYASER